MRAIRQGLLSLCVCALVAETVEVGERPLWLDAPPDGEAVRAAVLWLHDRGRGPLADREQWLESGLRERGVVLAFYQAPADGWEVEVADVGRGDHLLAVARLLRERYQLEPTAILLAGEGAGASHAQRLVLARPYWFAGAVLARGADGQAVDPAGEHRPVFGIYAAATDRRVPVASLRRVERRLRDAGYPVHWRSELRPEGYGDGLFQLTTAVLVAAGLLDEAAAVDEATPSAPAASADAEAVAAEHDAP